MSIIDKYKKKEADEKGLPKLIILDNGKEVLWYEQEKEGTTTI